MADDFNPFDMSSAAPAQPQAAPQDDFNPFEGSNFGQVGLAPPSPPPGSPPVDVVTQRRALDESRPTVQKIGEFGTEGDKTDQARVLHTALAQGVAEAYMGPYELALDIGNKLGFVKDDTVKNKKAEFNSERQQYQNIPYIKNHETASSIISQGASFGLGMIGPGAIAKGAGLAGSFLKNLAGDVLAAGGSGFLQSPGDTQNPLQARAVNAGVQGALQGAVSASLRLLGGLRGAPTPERIAGQQANAAALEPVGGGTVGQVIGDTNGIMGQRVAAAEAELANKVPFLGGDDAMFAQQEALKDLQKGFVSSLQPKATDITNLTKGEAKAAAEAGVSLPDAAITKAYTTISQKTDALPGLSTTPILESLAPLEKKLTTIVTPSPSDKLLVRVIQDLKSQGELSFDQLWGFRKQLDNTAFTSAGGLKPTFTNPKDLGTLRDTISEVLQKQATQAGVGTEWKNIAKQYSQNLAFKKLEDLLTTSASPLGRGGLSPGRGLLSFAKALEKGQASLGKNLNPEQKQAMKGIINITRLTAKQLRTVKPGIDTLGAVGTGASLGGLTAVAGGPVAGAMGALTYGLTALMHSNLGREMLTYAGKNPMSNLKVQQIAMRLMQGGVGGESQPVTQKVGQDMAAQQPQSSGY